MKTKDNRILQKVEQVHQEEIPGDEYAKIPCEEVSDPVHLCENPLVSVVMITYNHEPYIRDAIEGVVSQRTDFSFELIIGEDCSTDRTRNIVLEYQKRYPAIIRILTSEKNVGMFDNGRRTRYACRGAYIAYCEGDDYWTDDHKLQEQIEAMRRHPECEVSFHPAKKVKAETGDPMGIMGQIYDHETILSASEVIDRGIAFMPTCSLCVKAQFFSRKENIDFFRKHAGSFFTKFLPAVNGGALYINSVMAARRASSIGSWTQRARENSAFAVESHLQFNDACDTINRMTGFEFKDALQKITYSIAWSILCRRNLSIEDRMLMESKYLAKFNIWQRGEIYIYTRSGVCKMLFYCPYVIMKRVLIKTRTVLFRIFSK